MKQQDFTQRNSEHWKTFEELLTDTKLAKNHDVPKLFRQISNDLATAKARQYSPDLIQRLNDLLLRGQDVLYKSNTRFLRGILDFFIIDFGNGLFDIRKYVIWAHIIFYVPSFIVAGIVVANPESTYLFADSDTLSSLESMYDPSDERFTEERASQSDFLMFGHYIRNNISIAFNCFVGGVVFGLGSIFFMIFNAIMFGAASGHIINVEYGSTFFSFIVTHGSFELTAIVISGAAGLVLGKHLISPGRYSRIQSLKQAGKRTFPVIIGCFIMLIFAAFVEAFWSSSMFIPNIVKYIVGGICWVVILWFVFARRRYATR